MKKKHNLDTIGKRVEMFIYQFILPTLAIMLLQEHINYKFSIDEMTSIFKSNKADDIVKFVNRK